MNDKRKKNVIVAPQRDFGFYFKVFLFSVLSGLVLTAVFYIVYKLKLKKEFNQRTRDEVNNALSKYYQESATREITGRFGEDDN